MLEFALSSEEEEESKWGGSRKGRAPNKKRDFAAAYQGVVRDYFNGGDSVYSEADFERRFRMPRSVFDRIQIALLGTDPFVQKKDVTGKLGIHPLVRLVACFRYIAYGDAYDREDENLRIAQSTLNESVRQFAALIIQIFGPRYLNRSPSLEERRQIAAEVIAAKGFPGCLASWDCKHFTWGNCPMRWAGQHKGHSEGGKKTLILEAIADHRKYLWAVNFGDAGSLNDLNVLDKSSIVGSLLTGDLSLKTDVYSLNGNPRDWMYLLVDGIYPEWSIFVNTFSNPTEPDKKTFAKHQEKVRKDIECAFGIMVKRFHVLGRPLRGWYVEDLRNLIHACTILHNMITVERFGDVGNETSDDNIDGSGIALFGRQPIAEADAAADGVDLFAARVSACDTAIQSPHEHFLLKRDLVIHINDKYN